MYGIQPIWPSEYASLRSGNSTSTPENRKSHIEPMALLNDSVACTAAGASGDVAGIFDEEPMCMQITVSVSSHAVKNGPNTPV